MTEAPAVDPLAFVDDVRCAGHGEHLWHQREDVQEVTSAGTCRATLAAQLDQCDVRKFRRVLRDHVVVRDLIVLAMWKLIAERVGDEVIVETSPFT